MTHAVTSPSPHSKPTPSSHDISSPDAGLIRWARDALLIAGRHLSASRRDPGSAYITPTIIPLALIGVVSQIFGLTADLPGFPTENFVDWMLPGMVIMTGMFGGGATAIRVVNDFQSGYLDRLRLLPVAPSSVLAGGLLFDAIRTIPPAVAVLIVGLALGAPLDAGIGAAVALLAIAMLWAMTWNSVFLAVGLRTRSEQAILAIVPLFLPMWWTSSVLISEELMPNWIANVSAINPISLLVDGIRPLAIGGPVDTASLAAGLAVAVGLLAILQVVAMRFYRRLSVA